MSSPTQLYQEVAWVPQEQTPVPEHVRSSWRFLASLSSNLLLIGFLVIPLAFESPTQEPVSKVNSVVAAAVLIGFADALVLILICFQYDKREYLIRSIYLPGLTANLIGLLNVILNILCRDLLPIGDVEAASLGLACSFAFLHALGALWVYGRMVAEETRMYGPKNEAALLTEEEMQRQQLLRLLQENNKKGTSPKVTQKTFQVKVPERINPGKGWDTFMPPPHEEGYFAGYTRGR
ncbi:hypothetical protein P170DRAFT_476879 [Aspergillus steynii IBT 23096]|uniref:Uncharacterized protein n=1 Tax=Aspergillus steynii IBT 23096 TaxID=1392250 RepID=A0A2I2G5U6_9EURO|nr:uncharacterized protein P170DRAFT_476879 [Aspergillus steynii IBT 23096]PLB48254.1 hypothetical protein P170DRAFT_476879 [Aspergillus steynii IBT 23096]